jgi:hypothetical protein
MAIIALLPACAAPSLAPAMLPATGALTASQRPSLALNVTRVVNVPPAVEKAYTAALKDTLADYKADSDITSVTVTPLRPIFRLAQPGGSPVYIMTAMGNLIGKVDRDTVATGFSVGFAFDEAGRDAGFGSSCFVDSVASTVNPASRRLRSRAQTPWDFQYMTNVPGDLNVALDLLHNREMDDLQAMYTGKHLQPLKPTPGPGRIVAIRHKETVVGYIESLRATMWDTDRMHAKGVEVVNVFDPQGVMIEAEGRYLDPEQGANHKTFQFAKHSR